MHSDNGKNSYLAYLSRYEGKDHDDDHAPLSVIPFTLPSKTLLPT
jgi:hypothetical protein